MLACQWMKDFMTRRNMRKKWGRGPMISEYFAGLRECKARSNPYHHVNSSGKLIQCTSVGGQEFIDKIKHLRQFLVQTSDGFSCAFLSCPEL